MISLLLLILPVTKFKLLPFSMYYEDMSLNKRIQHTRDLFY